MKFGGTSVADLDRIRNVAARVKREVDAGNQVAVVVSAMSGVTNQLVGWCQALSPLHDAREYDTVVATGEQVTSGLLAIALQEIGVDARSWQGWQIPLQTDGAHGRARIENIEGNELIRRMQSGQVPVVAGFQGIGPDNRATTLGRGGSDTSAVALAAALKADRCDIYTDVDGVYTTDPRIVAKARKLSKIAFEEMLELASVGAKVLQTRSVELAMKERVRVQVLSSFDGGNTLGGDLPGTLVVDEDEIVEKEIVSGIAYSRDEAKITVKRVPDRPGIAAAIFGPLSDAGINVDMIVQNVSDDGNTDMTFTIGRADLPRAKATLGRAPCRDRLCRAAGRPGRRQNQRGRRRHAQPYRCRQHHVHRAGQQGHQHPGHFHQRNQGLRPDRGGLHGTGRARPSHRLWARCRLTSSPPPRSGPIRARPPPAPGWTRYGRADGISWAARSPSWAAR